jgi:hypothetical protein
MVINRDDPLVPTVVLHAVHADPAVVDGADEAAHINVFASTVLWLRTQGLCYR